MQRVALLPSPTAVSEQRGRAVRHLMHCIDTLGIRVTDLTCLVLYFAGSWQTEADSAALFALCEARVAQLLRVVRLADAVHLVFDTAREDVARCDADASEWHRTLVATSFDQLAFLRARVSAELLAPLEHRMCVACFGRRAAGDVMRLVRDGASPGAATETVRVSGAYRLFHMFCNRLDAARSGMLDAFVIEARRPGANVRVFDTRRDDACADLYRYMAHRGLDMQRAQAECAAYERGNESSHAAYDLSVMHAVVLLTPAAAVAGVLALTHGFLLRRARALMHSLANFAVIAMLVQERFGAAQAHALARLTAAILRTEHIAAVLGDFARARAYDFLRLCDRVQSLTIAVCVLYITFLFLLALIMTTFSVPLAVVFWVSLAVFTLGSTVLIGACCFMYLAFWEAGRLSPLRAADTDSRPTTPDIVTAPALALVADSSDTDSLVR